jgi:hypothetical protein
VTLSTLVPARLERPARSAEAAAMRSQIAEASKRLPPELVGPDGNPRTRDEAASAFLRWAGDDPAKRALARVLELAAPKGVTAHAPPPGSSRPPAPRPLRPPRPSAWDPDPARGRR